MQATQQQEYVEFVTGATPKLRRTAYLLTGDGDRADDVGDGAFALAAAVRQFDGPDAMATWQPV
ncbi:hypothetical protein GA0070609_4094 [Micromonospora echinaurantiaca]|uniref:Sigma-70 region 2 n=1 Tax=Micromonospora echinaurantiaca TaxID=47857 RepID=A0A1C5J5X9_9ACTN|nr:hypothetical protein [Micromonospora echinaurantiaca]SCG65957.1 hypothetical protein GA0070609_4094 [Micromonospora echinaurantiaca]